MTGTVHKNFNIAYWNANHALFYAASTPVFASDGNVYKRAAAGDGSVDPVAATADWELATAAASAAATSTAAITGFAGGAASDVQTMLAALAAGQIALQSVLGQLVGQPATNAELEALVDVDGTTALEAGDWAILTADATDGGQARESGIYVYDGAAWPTASAYSFPDITAQRAPQTIALTTGTATYTVPGGNISQADLDAMVVQIGGAASLTRSDWSLAVSTDQLTFSAGTAALIATGMESQVTF